MTPPLELLELAERAEKATGPDRELDGDIEAAREEYPEGWSRESFVQDVEVQFRHVGNGRVGIRAGGEFDLVRWDAPTFTASLDAAMQLVPQWAKLHFLQDTEYDNPAEKTWSANLRAREEKADEPGFGSEWQSWCATPALALCAAALRALASQGKPNA